MKRFKKILVACTQDTRPELAVERAATLAKANGASVVLMDIVDFDSRDLDGILTDASDRTATKIQNQVFHYHLEKLAKFEKQLRELGVKTKSTVSRGLAFVEIIRAVLRNDFDIVIKGISSTKTGSNTGFEPLDMHLMRKCPCPVWVVRGRLIAKRAKLAAAVNPEFDDREREHITRMVMDLSTSLCTAEQGTLHIVNAWKIQEEEALLNSTLIGAKPYEVEKIKKNKRSFRARELKRLMSFYHDPSRSYKTHLFHGDAGEVIPRFTRKNKIDLVVMGTVNRTDIPGLFMGNTAEMILGRIACSVLAVKPPNFKTPIELSETDIGVNQTRLLENGFTEQPHSLSG